MYKTIGRKLVFAAIAAVLVLASAEGLVRLFAPHLGPGVLSPLSFQRHTGPISSPGKESGTLWFGGPQVVTQAQPVGLRIFFFGGSATQGFHMSPWSAFPGWYQRLLRLVDPQTVVEVINLGAGGEASRQVVDLLREAGKSQVATLFVVYSGNNEYYELRAMKESVPGFDARLELARRRFARSHLYRWARTLMGSVETGGVELVGQSVDLMAAEIDEAERELGVLFYRENLEAMVRAAEEADIPLLMSTVADHTMSFAVHGAQATHSEGVDAGLEALGQAGISRDAAAVQHVLSTLSPRLHSQADHHAVGTLLYRDGFFERARSYFEEAEYLDPRPRRSNRALRQALRAVAEETGTPLCDVATLLAQRSVSGISGDDVFFDPCHPNALGHQRLGEILLRCSIEQDLLPLKRDKVRALQMLAAEGRSVGATVFDPHRLDLFTGRRAQLQDNRAMTEPEIQATIRGFADGTAAGATLAGHHAFLFNKRELALQWYEHALSLGGPAGALQLNRGLVLQRLGRMDQARTALDAARQKMPEDAAVAQYRAVLGEPATR